MSYPKGVELCDTHHLSLKLRGVSAARGRALWLTKKGLRAAVRDSWDINDRGVVQGISSVQEDHPSLHH